MKTATVSLVDISQVWTVHETSPYSRGSPNKFHGFMKTWRALIGCFMKLMKFIWLAKKVSWFHGFHGDGVARCGQPRFTVS
jgi:hypothetical protein